MLSDPVSWSIGTCALNRLKVEHASKAKFAPNIVMVTALLQQLTPARLLVPTAHPVTAKSTISPLYTCGPYAVTRSVAFVPRTRAHVRIIKTSVLELGNNDDTHEDLTAPVPTTEQPLGLGGPSLAALSPTSDELTENVELLQSAVDLNPRSAVARAELGRALVRVGKAAQGFESLVAAFEIDSLCPGAKDGFREYYHAEIEASWATHTVDWRLYPV